MLKDTVKTQILEAMKARDAVRLSTLKMLSSELHNATIDNKGDLSEKQEVAVVKKEAKKRKDAIEALRQAQGKQTSATNIDERIDTESKELVILQEFMPAEMGDEELNQLISESITQTNATTVADIGKVMSAVMAKTNGQADGSRVSVLVKEKLSS